MELLDVYNKHRIRTGKVIEREAKLNDGEYIYAVHIYIFNKEGKWLIQKRSEKMKNFPGLWQFTSGCMVVGEDSLSVARRKVYEELGILIPQESLQLKGSYRRKRNFVDIWFAKTDYNLEDIVMDENEVADVKFISKDEMITLVNDLPNRESDYKEMVVAALKNIR